MIESPDLLAMLLHYDPETGKLYWRPRGNPQFDAKHAGKEAFTALANGYKHGDLMGKRVRAHRVVWALVHGEWPKDDIDHINHDRTDNRVENLRHVSRKENMRNMSPHSRNTSGRIGVSPHRAGGWVAQWREGDKYVGRYFKSFDDACAARAAAEIANGYHKNHGMAAA